MDSRSWLHGEGGGGGVLAARLGGRSGRINTCVVEEEDSESENTSGSRISHLSGCIRALLVHETVVKKELILCHSSRAMKAQFIYVIYTLIILLYIIIPVSPMMMASSKYFEGIEKIQL